MTLTARSSDYADESGSADLLQVHGRESFTYSDVTLENISQCVQLTVNYISQLTPRRNLFGINSYRPVLPIVDVEVKKLWAKLDTNNVDYIVGTNSHDHYGPYASWNVKLCEIFELPGRGQVIDVRSKVFAIWDLVPL